LVPPLFGPKPRNTLQCVVAAGPTLSLDYQSVLSRECLGVTVSTRCTAVLEQSSAAKCIGHSSLKLSRSVLHTCSFSFTRRPLIRLWSSPVSSTWELFCLSRCVTGSCQLHALRIFNHCLQIYQQRLHSLTAFSFAILPRYESACFAFLNNDY